MPAALYHRAQPDFSASVSLSQIYSIPLALSNFLMGAGHCHKSGCHLPVLIFAAAGSAPETYLPDSRTTTASAVRTRNNISPVCLS